MMRVVSYYVLFLFCIFLTGCSEYEFVKSEQHSAAFNKVVSIEDLVYLKNNTQIASFAEPLQIQATVTGVFGNNLYMADNSKYAMSFEVPAGHSFKVGDYLRIPAGGSNLEVSQQRYVLGPIHSVESLGQGSLIAVKAPLEEVVADRLFYSSKLLSIEFLSEIKMIAQEDEGRYYGFKSGNASAQFFVSDSMDLTIPSTLASIQGFLRGTGDHAVFHINNREDIRKVYVEPTMMEKIMNNSSLVKSMGSSTELEISPGVKYAQFSYTNTDNLLTSGTLLEIDLANSNVKIEPATSNNAGVPIKSIQTLATMASHKNNSYTDSWRVLAAISGDFYQVNSNPLSYVLNGPLIQNGVLWKADFINTTDHFFGVLKDNKGFVIGGRQEFNSAKDDLMQAAGGRIVLKEGKVVEIAAIREPRPAIGYTKGNKVYFFVGNGRALNISNGFTPLEVAILFKALGCEGAVYMNGGGATIGVLEDSLGEYKGFSSTHATNPAHNPSLAAAWMIVTKR